MRHKSVGGYFILIASVEILDGKPARAELPQFLDKESLQVHVSSRGLSPCIVLLEEALTGEVDLRNWPEVIKQRRRATSSDKRMAIEGALLRETVRQEGADVLWIDGVQNIANVLTKHGAEKETLREFLRTGIISLSHTPENAAFKERKSTRSAHVAARPSSRTSSTNAEL